MHPESIQLQLALDVASIECAVSIAEEAIASIDRLEIGTPLILSEGAPRAISTLKARFPNVPLIADCKIMDCGWDVTRWCIEAGASGVIVQAAAPHETLAAVCEVAAEYGAETAVDTLGIDEMDTVVARIDGLSFDYVILHRGKDEQVAGGTLPLHAARAAAAEHALPAVAIAGGVDPENVADCAQAPNVEVVIVGEAIVHSPSPRMVAAKIRDICDRVRMPV